MTKTEFIDWKQHPVTQNVFSQLTARVQNIQEILGQSAGTNPAQDREFVGAVKAYNDILNMDFEEEASND